MTEPARPRRTLSVGALARVEGEGALRVEVRDGRLHDVQLRIYEPPRFFEALLRGRAHTEPPDITARVCGICPVAYQMSACAAIEQACGVTVDGPVADLRRLLYLGEWIESHLLHIHMLHAPDFLGHDGIIDMAVDHEREVRRGLDLKKAGNDLVALVGGRAIHPVNVRLGGFHRAPTVRELRGILSRLDRARELAEEVVDWVARFDFPDFTGSWELAALRQPDAYPITGGTLWTTAGASIEAAAFEDHLEERQVPHSTALHASLRGHGTHLTGALARFALNADRLAPVAREAATRAGLDPSCRNPFRSIVARAVEVLHAFDEAVDIIDRYEEPDAPAVSVEPVAGVGHGWTEAPRGVLWHRYELDGDGTLVNGRIVPPTSQNQAAIEADLRSFLESALDRSDVGSDDGPDDDELTAWAERLIRNHDPCISCATHFLDLTIERT